MVHANAIPMLTVPTLPGMIHPTIFAQAPFGSCPVWFVPQLVRAPFGSCYGCAEFALVTLSDCCRKGDGAAIPFDGADVIYVNAGATRPADAWLDRLNDGGRLILPLTAKKSLPPDGGGPIARHRAVFRIERRGDEYLAKWISAVGVYPCEGGRDVVSEAAIDTKRRLAKGYFILPHRRCSG